MCLAIPAQIVILLEHSRAVVELGGIRKEISLELIDEAKVGDYVIVHAGFALSRLDEEEALRTLALFSDMGREE
jgi:hydrogenase expression/formation protein HypC